MKSFNVITEAWIPAIKTDNTSEKYSVLGLLKDASNIKHILSPGNLPSEEYAVYRFLFALVTDAFDIESDEEIEEIYRNGAFDIEIFEDYIAKCGNVFDVFDEEHPFMQCSRERAISLGAKSKNIAELSWSLLSGNTETFFGVKEKTIEGNYESSQDMSIGEYISLIINITFMQSMITSRCATAVCDSQPPLWFMFNGRTLFDTMCLNLYPKGEDDIPMWRRNDFLWYPKDEPEGWLSLAFMPTRIVAPDPDGYIDGKVKKFLYKSVLYRNADFKRLYPEPKTYYDWWKNTEPYIILKHNDLAKLKKEQKDKKEVEAWKGPTGLAWMHMAEFYGVKLDDAKTERPKVMQIYGVISNKEKEIIKMLMYKPTQTFYSFELWTQSNKLLSQKVFRDFTVTEDWMYEDSKLEIIQAFTLFTRFAMRKLTECLKDLLYSANSGSGYESVNDIVNGWADQCAQYMYNKFIPGLETLKTEESSEYLNKAKIDIVNITKDFLGKIKMRDMIVKISRTNRLINSLKNKLRRDR